MSDRIVAVIQCDECTEEFTHSTKSISGARRAAKKEGWLVNQKPTTQKPSLYSQRADFCPLCRP